MIGVDTNVLVRFLVEDDPSQTERSRAFLQRAVEREELCFVSEVVVCELVWVLERSYKVRRLKICEIFGRLIRAQYLAFPSVERIARALESYRDHRGGFADYLIRENALDAGCATVATFDGDLLKEAGFSPL